MPRHDRLRNNIKPMQPHFNTQPLPRRRHSRITKWQMSIWRSCAYNICDQTSHSINKYTLTRAHTHTYIHTHKYTRARAHTHAQMTAPAHAHAHTHTHTHTHTHDRTRALANYHQRSYRVCMMTYYNLNWAFRDQYKNQFWSSDCVVLLIISSNGITSSWLVQIDYQTTIAWKVMTIYVCINYIIVRLLKIHVFLYDECKGKLFSMKLRRWTWIWLIHNIQLCS